MSHNRKKIKGLCPQGFTPKKEKVKVYCPVETRKRYPKLVNRFAKANALLGQKTPESRKAYKEMSQHSYGRDRHNLDGFWNSRKKPRKMARTKCGLGTLPWE